MVCSYASKVVDVAEDSGSPVVELPGDETGDVLAVSRWPPEAEREADVGVIGSIDVEADQRPIPRNPGAIACRPGPHQLSTSSTPFLPCR